MNSLKKAFIGLGIVATSFGVKAQSNNVVAFNENTTKTEVKSTASYIHEGHTGNARTYSIDNPKALVICISGGTMNEKYTAEQYANMLHKMFLDPARTKYPTDVVFFIEETGENLPTAATVYIDGLTTYWGGDQYSGRSFIHPYKLVPEIPNVTADHAKKNGLALLSPETKDQLGVNQLAQN